MTLITSRIIQRQLCSPFHKTNCKIVLKGGLGAGIGAQLLKGSTLKATTVVFSNEVCSIFTAMSSRTLLSDQVFLHEYIHRRVAFVYARLLVQQQYRLSPTRLLGLSRTIGYYINLTQNNTQVTDSYCVLVRLDAKISASIHIHKMHSVNSVTMQSL